VRQGKTDLFSGITYPGLRPCLHAAPGATTCGRLGPQGSLSAGAGTLGKVPW